MFPEHFARSHRCQYLFTILPLKVELESHPLHPPTPTLRSTLLWRHRNTGSKPSVALVWSSARGWFGRIRYGPDRAGCLSALLRV